MTNIKLTALLFLLILSFGEGCIKSKTPAETGEAPLNGTQIQRNFEENFLLLKESIESGNIKESKEYYNKMVEMYHLAEKVVGKEHLEFFVLEEELNLLGKKIEMGDLESAKLTLSDIGGGCGVKFCHARAGTSMARLEVEYGSIKRAVEEGNLSEAAEHLPMFKKYWTESKEDVSTVMPRITEILMKDEYLNNLEEAITSGDEERSKKALEAISNNTCSFMGCHKVFFKSRSLWKF
jgi:hypothetical protein